MKPIVLILVTLVVLMAIAFAFAWDYPYLQAKIMPLGLSGMIIILSIVEIVKELSARKRLPSDSVKEETKVASNRRRRTWIEAAWVVGFVAAVFVFGFLFTVFSFSVAYTKSRSARWSISIISAAVLSLTLWVLTYYLLNFKLYVGLIPRLLGFR